MAGFGSSSGAGKSSNAAPLSTDTSLDVTALSRCVSNWQQATALVSWSSAPADQLVQMTSPGPLLGQLHGLSKKQRLTELCCKTDARGGGGRRPPERAIRTRRGLIIVGRHKDRAIAMNIAASLVAGLVLPLVLGIWLYAMTIWLFVH